MILPALHDRLGPVSPSWSVAAGPYGDLEHLLFVVLCGIEVSNEAAVDLQLGEIILSCHVAAAVPAFIADPEQRNLVGLWMTVRRALVAQCRRLWRRHVLEPLG